jgi:hypothetical protein
MLNDAALPEKGRHPVDVAPQDATALGKSTTFRRWCRSLRVRNAVGPPQRVHDMSAQHLPGGEVWQVGERRAADERSVLPVQLARRHLAPVARGRLPSQVGLREGASAASGGTRARTSRGPLVDRAAPPRANDDGRLTVTSLGPSRAGKELAVHRCSSASREVHQAILIALAQPHQRAAPRGQAAPNSVRDLICRSIGSGQASEGCTVRVTHTRTGCLTEKQRGWKS